MRSCAAASRCTWDTSHHRRRPRPAQRHRFDQAQDDVRSGAGYFQDPEDQAVDMNSGSDGREHGRPSTPGVRQDVEVGGDRPRRAARRLRQSGRPRGGRSPTPASPGRFRRKLTAPRRQVDLEKWHGSSCGGSSRSGQQQRRRTVGTMLARSRSPAFGLIGTTGTPASSGPTTAAHVIQRRHRPGRAARGLASTDQQGDSATPASLPGSGRGQADCLPDRPGRPAAGEVSARRRGSGNASSGDLPSVAVLPVAIDADHGCIRRVNQTGERWQEEGPAERGAKTVSAPSS